MTPIDESSITRAACAAQDGSRAAFGVLVDRLELPLFRYLRVRTGNRADAEELVQDTFLRAWDRIAAYDPTRPFTGWLYTIAARLAASHARRHRDAAACDGTLETLSAPDALALAVDHRDEERNLWRIAANVLGPEQRGALWLRYAEDLEAEEVARIIGKRTVTTRVLLHRARRRLVLHLEQLESDRQDRHAEFAAAAPTLPRATHATGPS